MKINIKPVQLGLGLGEATAVKISVDYTLTSHEVTLRCYVYNQHGIKLNISPINLDVPPETLQEWALDFSRVITWALDKLGAEIISEP
jgi:hypothetical protein